MWPRVATGNKRDAGNSPSVTLERPLRKGPLPLMRPRVATGNKSYAGRNKKEKGADALVNPFKETEYQILRS